MSQDCKSLKRNGEDRVEVVIAPLKRPRLVRSVSSLIRERSPTTLKARSASGPKFCGTDGKPTFLTQFDDATCRIHDHLHANHDCFYFIECTRDRSLDYSPANNFISNLRKSPNA